MAAFIGINNSIAKIVLHETERFHWGDEIAPMKRMYGVISLYLKCNYKDVAITDSETEKRCVRGSRAQSRTLRMRSIN